MKLQDCAAAVASTAMPWRDMSHDSKEALSV
jgi:hypothetical protein